MCAEKGMSETVSCTQLILHRDLRLGIIRYLFYFAHQADCGIKRMGREGGWLMRLEANKGKYIA